MSAPLLVGLISGVGAVSAMLLFALSKLFSRQGGGVHVEDGRGRAVLITGCDSGFGHALALRLDRSGFVVFAGCLAPGGGGARALAAESSGSLRILQMDVTSDEDVQRAKKIVQENLPEKGLWAVVNNAGVSDWAEIEWSSVGDFQDMLDVNLFGAIRTAIAFLPLVRASRGADWFCVY
ncbi:D-beta-hydroxybutyrate dehydrogenase, mitochondrial [Liparis tanakae]|uniref:D-beta-hydroxybutyrate dehydrogenase, mitochondrial n=1 Tax=Liparis tanakae TaxID=230148 RepID=A0A4Z2E7C2_9TELE|nr:D-beta-hydroxybutyrate dehydrogenase, mitochondrial [Liparis tanakae]